MEKPQESKKKVRPFSIETQKEVYDQLLVLEKKAEDFKMRIRNLRLPAEKGGTVYNPLLSIPSAERQRLLSSFESQLSILEQQMKVLFSIIEFGEKERRI